MTWWEVVILALVQGLSEFLPISSSAHLILPSELLGWSDQGLFFDISVHLGTLIAVVAYYRRDLAYMVREALTQQLSSRSEIVLLVVATLPVVLVGWLANEAIALYARDVRVIASTTVLFGLLLGLAASRKTAEGAMHQTLRLPHALLVGCLQTLALIPGVSRSGITITAALLLGYNVATAARFSFLLSIPVITGASVMMLGGVLSEATAPTALTQMVAGALIAGVAAYATIALFVRLLATVGMMPFVIYRLLLGALLFLFFV
jgi:undecaprenyl-diphosphatase